MNEHYRNINILNGLNLEAPIYKFFPLKYISTLLQGNLYVGKVAAWEDVYENFLFKQNFSLVDGTPVKADNLIKCNFGQSWTFPMKQMPCGEFIQISIMVSKVIHWGILLSELRQQRGNYSMLCI